MSWFEQVVILRMSWQLNCEDSYKIVTWKDHYPQISNISGTLVSNKIVDHWDVVEASPVGAAPTTSSFLT